jgi:hypothetical protein
MRTSIDDIVAISKCEDYPEQRVRQLAGDRASVSAQEALRVEGLSEEERLWVFTHAEMLEGSIRRKAACAIAEGVLPIFEKFAPENHHPRRALEAAQAAVEGVIADHDLAAARSGARGSLTAYAPHSLPREARAAVEAVVAAGDPDPQAALLHASSCAREASGHVEGEVTRQLAVIRGVLD